MWRGKLTFSFDTEPRCTAVYCHSNQPYNTQCDHAGHHFQRKAEAREFNMQWPSGLKSSTQTILQLEDGSGLPECIKDDMLVL